MDTDDTALLAAVRDGSQRAFNTLIDRHQQALRIFLRRLVLNSVDADDIAQETLLAVWTHAKSFRGHSSVRSWIFSIAWRKAKGAQRRWFRRSRLDMSYHESTPDNQEQQMTTEDRHALDQALALLPLEQRATVMLCLGCGLTHAEAAEALNAPLGTVKSHVLRGRARLRESLGETL